MSHLKVKMITYTPPCSCQAICRVKCILNSFHLSVRIALYLRIISQFLKNPFLSQLPLLGLKILKQISKNEFCIEYLRWQWIHFLTTVHQCPGELLSYLCANDYLRAQFHLCYGSLTSYLSYICYWSVSTSLKLLFLQLSLPTKRCWSNTYHNYSIITLVLHSFVQGCTRISGAVQSYPTTACRNPPRVGANQVSEMRLLQRSANFLSYKCSDWFKHRKFKYTPTFSALWLSVIRVCWSLYQALWYLSHNNNPNKTQGFQCNLFWILLTNFTRGLLRGL